MRKDYCVDCEIAIQIPEGWFDEMKLKSKPQEFKDGYCCEACSLVRVKKARGQK